MKHERKVAALLWAAASIPVLTWWARRLAEPFGVDVAAGLALPAILFFRWRDAPRTPVPAGSWLLSAALLAASVAVRGILPPTAGAVFAVLALLPLVLPRDGDGGKSAIAALALMSLPSLMIADLFLGLPLRLLATRLASALVATTGLPVGVEGTGLVIDGAPFWVDVPCAGVQMLGSALLLTFALAAAFRLRFRRTVLLAVCAVAIVVVANSFRIAALSFAGYSGFAVSSARHQGVGIASLAFGMALIALLALWMSRRERGHEASDVPPPPAPHPSRLAIPARAAFAAAALAGLALSCAGLSPREASPAQDGFPGWPTEFEGERLVEQEKSDFEIDFGARFPGRIGKFRCGERIVILRWVTAPTHRAHSTSYCLRASGWRIEPLPMESTARGPWSTCLATRQGTAVTVREQVLDADGAALADVSAWFWKALFSRTRGPWWIYSVVSDAKR